MADIVALISSIWSLIPFYLAWWGAFVNPGMHDDTEV